ncbi:MAG TPA: hypothetical protein VMU77_07395, partial [Acidimicrobiales bacterium]|nr:hypothetical protein [Acidimicrobiales bacterium]
KEFAKLATHRSGLAGILVGTETTTRIDNKQRSAAFASGNAKPEAAKGSATSATKPNKKGKS